MLISLASLQSAKIRAGRLRHHFTLVVTPLKHPKNRSTPAQSNPHRKTIQAQKRRSVPPVSPETAKRPTPLPRKALRRDGYRCTVTRKYDIGYTSTLPLTALDTLLASGSRIASTRLAHIFPPSSRKDINLEVYRYAHIDVQQELDGTQIHGLYNVLTLSPEMHSFFGDLMVWFEEVPVSSMLSFMLYHAIKPSCSEYPQHISRLCHPSVLSRGCPKSRRNLHFYRRCSRSAGPTIPQISHCDL